MRFNVAPLLALVVAGCFYVSRDQFRDFWDADGDGWPIGEDCNDTDDRIYPFAGDVRGDGCDADCGREPDADGDDWPDSVDCAPNDPLIYPCSPHEVDGDGIDHDCDGLDSVRQDICPTADPDFPDAPVIGPCEVTL